MTQPYPAHSTSPARNGNRTRRGWLFAAGGLVLLCLVLVFCSAGGFLALRYLKQPAASASTPVASVALPDALASLGDIVSVPSSSQAFAVDEKAHQLDLGDGMHLQVPAGAFSGPNQLVLTRVNVAFDEISFDAMQSPFYVLSTRDEVGVLPVSLVLELSIPTGDVTAIFYDGQNWQRIPGTPGETVRLAITHFSANIWGTLEWLSEGYLSYQQSQNPDLNISPTKMRGYIEKGDALTHSFFGVGESATQSQDEMCTAIQNVLAQYNTPSNREFPSDSSFLNSDLAPFLFAGSTPKSAGGYYYDVTATSLVTIDKAVLASDPSQPLSPAEVLKISIDANGGNIPLGVLAAHNYLKQIKYQGLYEYHLGKPFPAQWGTPASHLASWREDSNITPAGEYDKMGPIYHIFAAMTAELWFPTQYAGHLAVNGEAMLRTFRVGGDRPDLQKALADACGDQAALWLRDDPSSDAVQPVQPPSSPGGFTPFTATDCTVPGLTSAPIQPSLISDTEITCFFQDPVNGAGKTFTLYYFPDASGAQNEFASQRAAIQAGSWSGTKTLADDAADFKTLYYSPATDLGQGMGSLPAYYHVEEIMIYRDTFVIYISCQVTTDSQQEELDAAADLLGDAQDIVDQHMK